jgi:hypothetical protein
LYGKCRNRTPATAWRVQGGLRSKKAVAGERLIKLRKSLRLEKTSGAIIRKERQEKTLERAIFSAKPSSGANFDFLTKKV